MSPRPGQPRVHELLRNAKIAGIAAELPPAEVEDPGPASDPAKVLVVGWGSSYGPVSAAARRVRLSGRRVATLHLRHLNPLPPAWARLPPRTGARAGDEPGPACALAARHLPRRRPELQSGACCRSHCRNSPTTSSPSSTGRTDDDRDARGGHARWPSRPDPQGLHLRPGGALVPRLRRLRGAGCLPGPDAPVGHPPREHRDRVGHRLLALPLLRRFLRPATDPRPRPGHRDRHRHRPSDLRYGWSPATGTR